MFALLSTKALLGLIGVFGLAEILCQITRYGKKR